MKNILKTILIAFVCLVGTFTFVNADFNNTSWNIQTIEGPSMEPTMVSGESYFFYMFPGIKYERNDVIVFKYNDSLLCKRIIGLPGETIEVVDGRVLIDGDGDIDKFKDITLNKTCRKFNFSVKLGDDEYFLLGDNRNDSWDCRYMESHKVSSDLFVYKVAVD